MSEKITDELREFAKTVLLVSIRRDIIDIADRIDEAHEKACEAERRHVLVEEVTELSDDDLAEHGLMHVPTFDPDSPDPQGIEQLEGWAQNSGKVTEEPRQRILGMCQSIRAEWRAKLAKARESAYDNGREDAEYRFDNLTDDKLDDMGLMRLPVDADGVPWHMGDKCDFSVSSFTVIGAGGDEIFIETKDRGLMGLDSRRYRHHRPTPAERIRELAKSINYNYCCEYGHDPDSYVWSQVVDLLAIADELEGDAE